MFGESERIYKLFARPCKLHIVFDKAPGIDPFTNSQHNSITREISSKYSGGNPGFFLPEESMLLGNIFFYA
jgi:hypothetical protein